MRPRPLPVQPPPSVLTAFACDTAVRLTGGQGTAFRAGALVLKPVDDHAQHQWLVGVLAGLPPRDDLRVIRPVPTSDGGWSLDGWAAWTFLPGASDPGRWRDALVASDAFHRLVEPVAWSAALRGDHPWAAADEFAWGERELELGGACEPLVGRLLAQRVPLDLPSQLMHGDLCGNIVFHPELPPGIIDISPYWRPKSYADAILVADAIAWAGAPIAAVDGIDDQQRRQLLLRALLFRMAAAAIIFEGHASRITKERDAYEPVATGVGL